MDNPVPVPPTRVGPTEDFDEETYLRYNPDVRAAVQAGAFRSGRDHYEHYGKSEGRPYRHVTDNVHGQVVITNDMLATRVSLPPPACAIETICVSDNGGIFIAGWVEDAHDPLDSIGVYFSGWSVSYAATALVRLFTPAGSGLSAAFWGFIFAGRYLPAGQCSIILKLRSGVEIAFASHAANLTDEALRRVVLQHLGMVSEAGDLHLAGATGLSAAVGDHLVLFNSAIANRALTGFHVQTFGDRASCKTSMICMNAAAGTLALQTALFTPPGGRNEVEIIHVSPTPAHAEALLREAELCARIYGAAQTIILLQGEASFAAAQNLAAAQAGSARLLFVSPGMYPQGPDWLGRHEALLDHLPAAQTALFGVPLYHEDSVLAAAGWYFEPAMAPRAADLRLQPYRSPASRPVPVIDRFMSIARPHFESLGGFAEGYFTADYAYADLCLNSIGRGSVPWLHDLPLWDLAVISHNPGAASLDRGRLQRHRAGIVANCTGMQPSHPLFA